MMTAWARNAAWADMAGPVSAGEATFIRDDDWQPNPLRNFIFSYFEIVVPDPEILLTPFTARISLGNREKRNNGRQNPAQAGHKGRRAARAN
jgi:hypothetical protein